jgi:hypothetical protein
MYKAALENAFQLAPSKVQAQLCNLGGVYVNGDPSGSPCSDFISCFDDSWGYRAKSNKKGYIAISAGLWTRANYSLSLYETDILNAVYGWNSGWTQYVKPPYYNNVNSEADNFDMTILAALAHELGHVFWYQALNPGNPGGDYKPNEFCSSTFFAYSWNPVHRPDIWRYFPTRSERNGRSNIQDTHLISPQISEIDGDLNGILINQAGAALDQLYQQSYPWANYFGAVAPDEDFVETYKLWVLTNAQSGVIAKEGPLRSLQINIPFIGSSTATENVLLDYGVPDQGNYGVPSTTNKRALAAKALCIAQKI